MYFVLIIKHKIKQADDFRQLVFISNSNVIIMRELMFLLQENYNAPSS